MSRYVVCLARDIDGCEFLKVYRALDDEAARGHGLIRVIDESGEDYLYPEDRFTDLRLAPEATEALDAVLAT